MLFLSPDQHEDVLQRLVDLGGRAANGVPLDRPNLGYASLMLCFLLQNLSSAETLLRISSSFGNEWFPVAVGYVIARTMFEVDVTAHYISNAPVERVPQYIQFTAVLNKRAMDNCKKHRGSKDLQWREAMDFLWQNHWAQRESDVVREFEAVAPEYTRRSKKGKSSLFPNWSGKTIREIATEVGHEEAYDLFYTELSSFAHADVHLPDRYLKLRPDGPVWSQRASEYDVGNVFRHAASFLTCYLELFGRQFKTWTETEVGNCWIVSSSRE